ncbi:MAG: hypothetical protein E7010_00690 [Alphaproteobacteria bacterium]|nr:hypothetical protein [Alphaproteobacteria bacterium]
MDYAEITSFSLGTPATGDRNQILGAMNALADLTGIPCNPDNAFLLPKDCAGYTEIKESIYYTKYKNYETFRTVIFELMDCFFEKHNIIPRIFITAYNLTENKATGENVDMLCRAVKEYYKTHDLGELITAVLSSRLHKYKYVDIINIPKHLLTFRSRIRLLRNRKLKKKVLLTVGTINDFSRKNVKDKNKILLNNLKKLSKDADVQQQIEKLKNYRQKSKKVVICLGGRVEGPEIVFDVNYAKKLLTDAVNLSHVGYGVVFVNGPRTPNEVTDYLYTHTLDKPDIVFQNCKKIAQDDSERVASQWRIYSGANEEIFRTLQKIGNIYPGILGFENTLVVHSADTYACCETANAALPTAISSNGLYIDASVRYDCLNLKSQLCPKYAIDWDEFVNIACNMGIEPNDMHPLVLSSPRRVFAEACINRLNQIKKDRKLY